MKRLRWTALAILCGIGDIYFSATPRYKHNTRIFVLPDGGPAEFLPWDMDYVFFQSVVDSIFPTATANISKLMNRPATRRIYLGQVYDLCQNVFNPVYMTPWLAHYGSVVGQDFTGGSSYIASRRASALGQLPPPIPFRITSNNHNDFLTNTPTVTISGSGWIDIGEITLDSSASSPPIRWTTITNWEITAPLSWA